MTSSDTAQQMTASMAKNTLHKKTQFLFLKKGELYLLGIAIICLLLAWVSNTGNKNIIVDNAVDALQETVSERLSFSNTFIKSNTDEELANITSVKILELNRKNIFIYGYEQEAKDAFSLRFWTSNLALPSVADMLQSDDAKLYKLGNGYYVGQAVKRSKYVYITLLPIKWNYFVTNQYLTNSFVGLPGINTKIGLASGKSAQYNIMGLNGKSIFHLDVQGVNFKGKANLLSKISAVLSLMLLLLVLYQWSARHSHTNRYLPAFAVLMTVLLAFRILLYYDFYPISLRQFSLFDPTIFGSSSINKSLGDLLFNVICALWGISYIYVVVQERRVAISVSSALKKYIIVALLCGVLLFSAFAASSTIRSLIANGQISFDVLNFFTLNLFSVGGFLVLNCVCISFFLLSRTIAKLLNDLWPNRQLSFLLTIAVLGLLFLSVQIGNLGYGFEIYLLFWILLYCTFLFYAEIYFSRKSRIKMSPVFWIFFFCISVTAIIVKENAVKELQSRQHYAEVLAVKSNPATEALLHSMLTDYRADFLADNFYKFFDADKNLRFKDSLINNSISVYSNRFDTDILTYDSLEQSLYNKSALSYNEMNAVLSTQSSPTGIPGLYSYDQSYDKFHYLVKKTIIAADSALLGYVFIKINPRNSLQETIYPALFNRAGVSSIENSSDYAFAIYDSGRLVRKHNQFPFPRNVNRDFFAGKKLLLLEGENSTALWYKPGAQKAIVVARENKLAIESITLFSYLFGSFLILWFCWRIWKLILLSNLKWSRIRNMFTFTISNQIYGTILIFSIVSFIVIGIATILFFISKYEDNNRSDVSRLQQRILLSIQDKNYVDRLLASDSLSTIDSVDTFTEQLKSISDLYGVDINLYNLGGSLMYSSLALPYDKGIISKKINPIAYNHLAKKNEIEFYQKEKIGNLAYLSSYTPVLGSTGEIKAFINIPFFASQSKLREEISGFLVTIINLIAFIFLIAGLVALFITNRITNSINIIGRKMQQVHLGKRNEAIEWTRKDEIGKLVDEYNKMLAKLEKSAIILSKTEREIAWREMAKQVAHEIKNPLTPMRLSMQFLQKAVATNNPNVPGMVTSISKTLIEQIDHLSHMADEFSRFAQIELAPSFPIDLQEVLLGLQNLYEGHIDEDISWSLLDGPLIILGDKTAMNRVFTNLLQNAIQSISPDRRGKISITQTLPGKNIITKIRDNGTGIPAEITDKIFMPNFTTKSSGTGLGLAMSKKIVEHMKGEIYFSSDENGSVFTVILPVIKE